VAEEQPQRLALAPVPLEPVVLLHLWVQPPRLKPQLPAQQWVPQGQSLEQKPVQPQNSSSDLAPLPEQGLSSCSRSKEKSLTRLSLQQKPKLFCA
jgi:hypothetical protein